MQADKKKKKKKKSPRLVGSRHGNTLRWRGVLDALVTAGGGVSVEIFFASCMKWKRKAKRRACLRRARFKRDREADHSLQQQYYQGTHRHTRTQTDRQTHTHTDRHKRTWTALLNSGESPNGEFCNVDNCWRS